MKTKETKETKEIKELKEKIKNDTGINTKKDYDKYFDTMLVNSRYDCITIYIKGYKFYKLYSDDLNQNQPLQFIDIKEITELNIGEIGEDFLNMNVLVPYYEIYEHPIFQSKLRKNKLKKILDEK